MLKQLIKYFLSKINFYHKNEIYKNTIFREPDYLNFLDGLIISEIAKKNNYKIIQIGAMDGKTGDPIYQIINNKLIANKISLLAIEPQEKEFELLKKNYKGINNIEFSNTLVGNGDYVNFYSYKKTFKKKNNRGKISGNSSIMKSHLEKYIREAGHKDVDQYIDFVKMKSYKLKDIITEHPNFKDANMLFIDAEGFDDEVIYNSSIDIYNFSIIGYEHKALTEDKIKKLHNFLEKKNYKIFRWKRSDEVAIKL